MPHCKELKLVYVIVIYFETVRFQVGKPIIIAYDTVIVSEQMDFVLNSRKKIINK